MLLAKKGNSAEHDHRNATEAKGTVRDRDIALVVQGGGLCFCGRIMGIAFA